MRIVQVFMMFYKKSWWLVANYCSFNGLWRIHFVSGTLGFNLKISRNFLSAVCLQYLLKHKKQLNRSLSRQFPCKTYRCRFNCYFVCLTCVNLKNIANLIGKWARQLYLAEVGHKSNSVCGSMLSVSQAVRHAEEVHDLI